jgi:hypothetical protein
MTPDKDRKAAERRRYRDAGLVPIEVWVLPEHRARVQDYARRLRDTAREQIEVTALQSRLIRAATGKPRGKLKVQQYAAKLREKRK